LTLDKIPVVQQRNSSESSISSETPSPNSSEFTGSSESQYSTNSSESKIVNGNPRIEQFAEFEKPSIPLPAQNDVSNESNTSKIQQSPETEKPSISLNSSSQNGVNETENSLPVFKPPVDGTSAVDQNIQPQVEYNPTVVNDNNEILNGDKNSTNSSSKSRKRRNMTITLVNQNFNDPRRSPAIAAAQTKTNEVRAMTSNYLSCINVEGPIAGLALIDTGAENANLISKKYLADLDKAGVKIEILPDSTRVFSLNKEMKNHGFVSLSLKISGIQYPEINFLVVDSLGAYNFILGLPAIEQLKIVPNIAEGSVRIMEHTIPLNKNKQYQRTIPVRTNATIRLKPGYEYVIPVTPDSNECFNNAPDYYHLVIPSQTLLNLQVLKMPYGLSKNGLKYVKIANCGYDAIVLKQGALVARVVTVDQNSIVNAVSVDELLNDEKAMDDQMFIPTGLDGAPLNIDEIQAHLSALPEKLENIENGFYHRLTKLIYTFAGLFSNDKPSIQTKTQAYVPIKPGTVPISLPPYRASPTVLAEIRKMIKELEEKGLISKSKSPWAFPVVCVQRDPGGPYRFCVDYSKLTNSIIPDPYPLPRIDDTIDHLSNQKIFSVVDAQKGFWQIPVFEEHQERLAFITPFGKYQFKVLPFGYTLAPGIFQKAMNETLDGLLFLNCLVYIDDIIIFSENYEQHLKDLEQVFERLQAFNWKLKLEKCKFAQTKIQYLGHIVSYNKIEMLPKNLDKIHGLSPPKNVKELQKFLGLINYYRRFIQGLAYLTEPLLINLRQSKWVWEKDQQEAYAKILRKFTEEPILKLPDFDRPFILKTDASDTGYGAVLAQEFDGVEHPISFSSGSFCPAQRNYSAWEREALSVVLAVKKYEHYLKDKEFKIVTDNQINSYLLKPEKELQNQRTVRWQLYLKSFKYTIEHRPGKFLVLEDGLSRVLIQHFVTTNDIATAQQQDKVIQDLIKLMNNGLVDDSDVQQIYKNQKDNLILDNNVLYYFSKNNKRIVIPTSLQSKIIEKYHDLPTAGHLSYLKTFSRLSEHVWFPKMFSLVKDYCEKCHVCDKNRRFFKDNAKLIPIVSTKPFEVIVVDHCGPFSKTDRKNLYILTVVDHFTRKRWFIPVPDVSAETSLNALIGIFANFEFPQTILSDQGSGFTSLKADDFSKLIPYKIKFALTDQHNTVGSAEISNQIIENILRKFIDGLKQNNWDDFIGLAAYALNKSISVHKYSPDYLIFGRNPINPYIPQEEENQNLDEYVKERKKALDLALKLANENLTLYRKKIEDKVEPKRKFPKFTIGQWVYLKKPLEAVKSGLSAKLDAKALGPYKIIKVDDSKANVTIQLAPNYNIEVKNNLVRLSKDQDILLDPDEIKASKTSEIIILKSIQGLEKLKLEYIKSDKNKKQLKVPEELVGKRISILWKTGPYKGRHLATVIGYTANLKKSLVYYDQRNIETDPTTDYYAHDLRADSGEVWTLL
jgi:hypothetical protein